jgi:hypothetical protein
LIFFVLGYFPQRAINYLDDKMTKYLGIKKGKYEPIPLALIQGLTEEKALRLYEIGIEDVQNLAVADVNKLRNNLPFGEAMLCDWICQGILVLYFPEHIEKLRHLGVRTVLDLKECVLNIADEKLDRCAQILGFELDQLQYIKKVLSLDHMQTRMKELQGCFEREYSKRYKLVG